MNGWSAITGGLGQKLPSAENVRADEIRSADVYSGVPAHAELFPLEKKFVCHFNGGLLGVKQSGE